MPNCFTLTRKTDPEAGPVPFARIDDEMREAFGEPPDPDRYLCGWYDSIGFMLAMGKTFDEMRSDIFKDSSPLTHKVIDYLEEHFTPDAWAEIGRR